MKFVVGIWGKINGYDWCDLLMLCSKVFWCWVLYVGGGGIEVFWGGDLIIDKF